MSRIKSIVYRILDLSVPGIIQGDLSPASGESCAHDKEFVGEPFFFAFPFYKGEGMTVSLFYEEPVDIENRRLK